MSVCSQTSCCCRTFLTLKPFLLLPPGEGSPAGGWPAGGESQRGADDAEAGTRQRAGQSSEWTTPPLIPQPSLHTYSPTTNTPHICPTLHPHPPCLSSSLYNLHLVLSNNPKSPLEFSRWSQFVPVCNLCVESVPCFSCHLSLLALCNLCSLCQVLSVFWENKSVIPLALCTNASEECHRRHSSVSCTRREKKVLHEFFKRLTIYIEVRCLHEQCFIRWYDSAGVKMVLVNWIAPTKFNSWTTLHKMEPLMML